MPHFYDESLETLPLSEIKERQLNLLKQQFARAIQTPFYAQMIRNTGIDEIKTIADITRLPLLDKETLRKTYRRFNCCFQRKKLPVSIPLVAQQESLLFYI